MDYVLSVCHGRSAPGNNVGVLMNDHLSRRKIATLPRIPLAGNIDLTYRCNNNCRHCWLWIPPDSPEKKEEMTSLEIQGFVEEARAMGCRSWNISGGEPMLRPDFADIFELILSRSRTYNLNTNGALITPRIAWLMKKPGLKMIAFYGATAHVHDRITRNPGSFEAMMRGIAYLKEAGAGFTVQVIPMKDNFREFNDMLRLAETLSDSWRIGAPWLWLSASGDPAKNIEIASQRLDPEEVVKLDEPNPSFEESFDENADETCRTKLGEEGLFAGCVLSRREFHIDPYGKMSFCCFIKDPALRYDLRTGNFRDAWENFIPSLAEKIRGGAEYLENCGACKFREDCRWCAVYGFLEHRDYSAKVDYLCRAARESRRFKESWKTTHQRHYKIAGITIRVESDLPFQDTTFEPKFKCFEVSGPGDDNVVIRHRFSLPSLDAKSFGKEIYRRPPWAVFEKEDSWLYLGITDSPDSEVPHKVAFFTKDYSRGTIYHPDDTSFRRGNSQALTFFPTDQILIAQLLALRNGCYLHASGVSMKGRGLLFLGHSDAGKSTMVKLIKGKAEILCDDRIIVRKEPGGFRIHGTWSHGEVPDISAGSAPLDAIFFLRKSSENRPALIGKKRDITSVLLGCLIKPMGTTGWWENTLSLVEEIGRNVACYDLFFDKSGRIVEVLEDFVASLPVPGEKNDENTRYPG